MGHSDPFPPHLAPEPHPDRSDTRSPCRTTISHFDDSSDDDDDYLEAEEELRSPAASRHPNIPLHPIASMQDAFAESLDEATNGSLEPKPKLKDLDAKTRREKLLDEDKSEGPPNRLWRFRTGQKCHELRKLMAQISFGVYLLINGMANSNAQVLSILQGHIDEVDEFLEATMDDVRLATQDLNERLDFLKLPMENMEVFEQMLENRKFRLQIVEGNVKIEHILSRTSTAHTQTIRDISEGLRAAKQFSQYLANTEKGQWRQDRPDVVDVFDAMKGNTEGWYNAFSALESQSTLLSGLCVRLSTMIVEIDKRAGEVSRRTRFTLEPYSDPDGRPIPRSPESPAQATPPPSPPISKVDAPPRIKTLYFGAPMTSLLEDPESPVLFELPARPAKRITQDSDTMRESLPAFQYTPPESSKTIPELVVEPAIRHEEEAGSSESSDNESESSTDDGNENDNGLFILQPRTYTPVPPAPIPSPRVSAAPPVSSAPRVPAAPRPTPEEISIHIEAEEDERHSEDWLRESAVIVPLPPPRQRPALHPDPHPRPLQIKQRQASEPHELEAQVSHRTSLRDRVSLKIELPKDIHVPAANALELQLPRFPTPKDSPKGSPRSNRPQDSARGSHMDGHSNNDATKRYVNVDYTPPTFPNLIPSPASEHQYFRPVQASPHSPLQQRPHTAGTVGNRPGNHQRNAPSQMGMSMLSNVTTMTQDTSGTNRTVKKKRSAFGWLKKAFSLDEEERAAFEERRRQQPLNYYYDGRSPKFLDGKRLDRPPSNLADSGNGNTRSPLPYSIP
ncbi:hypothetical protein J7T55_003251 [Diaporthe amygdali]|uniref:uncharacterized protein n=1 Tax=Phomopsis amygdali TaxID=1214568 RepID=UPI0022FEA91F|nr:uncharacterized protein J7T55_003251 [Diaporthe amygdali]KAJ0122735.1 hypothetical protein J7T55_003251 [Diaporthe amygdali]